MTGTEASLAQAVTDLKREVRHRAVTLNTAGSAVWTICHPAGAGSAEYESASCTWRVTVTGVWLPGGVGDDERWETGGPLSGPNATIRTAFIFPGANTRGDAGLCR